MAKQAKLQKAEQVLKLQKILRQCCTEAEWKHLISRANFDRLFLKLETIADFEALCETAVNLLNAANIPRNGKDRTQRLLECREKVEEQLLAEGLRR